MSMKKKSLMLSLFLLLVLSMFTEISFADTTVYEAADTSDHSYYIEYENAPVKIANKYFLEERKNKTSNIYVSDDIEKKGQKIISIGPEKELYSTLLTNGKKIFYAVRSWRKDGSVTSIYVVNVDGKSRKKLTTLKTKFADVIPMAYYNGNLYLREDIHYAETAYGLKAVRYNYIYTYNMRSGGVKKVTKKEIFPGTSEAVVFGRYIYMNTHEKYNPESLCICAYDMKTGELVKIAKGSFVDATVSNGNLYYSLPGKHGSEKVYCCSLSGKGRKKLIATLPEYSTIGKITHEKIYYSVSIDENWIYSEPQYRCYDIERNTTQQIEFDTYLKNVGDTAYWK